MSGSGITIGFACGHAAEVDSSHQGRPTCSVCGEWRIGHVTAPPPVFRGAASGPCASPSILPPLRVPVVVMGKKNKDTSYA